jgi:tetratricopeptide (TPR) repeat protein
MGVPASGTGLTSGGGIQDVEVLLGAGLPLEAQKRLDQAAMVYANGDLALELLREAEVIAPAHPAVLIGLYRFFFYKGRLEECLEVCHICLAEAAVYNDLPDDWHQVQSSDADFGSYEMMPRFFLFVLKGYAYLQMRLGNLEEGLAATMKLLELDASDKIGATLLLEVYQRKKEKDADDA